MPFFNTGRASLTVELRFASHDRDIQKNDTRRNCTMVKVTGFGSAVRMALEDVLVRIEVPYQKPQRSFARTLAKGN